MAKGYFGSKQYVESMKSSKKEELSILTQPEMVPGVQPIVIQQGVSQFDLCLEEQSEVVIEEKIIYVDRPVTVYETKEVEVIKEIPIYKDREVIKEVIKEIEKPVIHVRTEHKEILKEIEKKVPFVPKWIYGLIGVQVLLIIVLLIK